MRTTESATPPTSPLWTWAFVAVCGAIPIVSLGGAIPTMLGAAAATTCYGLARDGRGPARRRVLWCSLVTLGAWCAFGGLAWAVTRGGDTPLVREARSAGPEAAPPRIRGADEYRGLTDLGEDERRAIYVDAIQRRRDIGAKEDQILERRLTGRSTRVLDKQLETLKRIHDSHLDFVAKRCGLTLGDVETIIYEGDAAGWPGHHPED